ncbi:hypothetical protein [Asticcacaulis sp. EMRT-3]|uniref:hypothetical protein n=1 Tax=Asticcacaulis sp. EMRT-3 TaxID=3040349 RepID=UPI0024AEF2AC|nr:hypothetical protein [Asticcacaulis sp. EMRT-3]MDI7775373.1 hypothetical protein [Asticcacaulis sp. EMRT-3]
MTGPLLATGWASCASADPYRDRHHQNDSRDDNAYRNAPDAPPAYRRDAPEGRGAGPRDDRINRAISVARSRGRVLDAGSQGGSVFWVRVDTGHGRVDLLVDANSGRIVGEK